MSKTTLNKDGKPRPRGRPFKKGQSGNPSGRPKSVAKVRDLAREYTTTAIETLVQICKTGDSDSARVAAANAILDRGHGKAPQFLDVEVTRNVTAVDLSDSELLQIASGEVIPEASATEH